MTTCSVKVCDRPVMARSWCAAHYNRWRATGDAGATAIALRRAGWSDEERFWDQVRKSRGCWLWQGQILKYNGYGHFWRRDQPKIVAHRFAYEQLVGPVPEGLELDHTCRVRACVNPAHLEPVTHAENMRRAKGMRKTHCPQGHPRVTSSGGQSYCPMCREVYRRRKRAERE